MKTLILMRHAKAEQSTPDFDRALSDNGKLDAAEAAKRLHKKNLNIDILISSPAKRAHKTVKIVAKELGYDEKNIDLQFSIYDAAIEDILHIIREIDDKHNTAMLFGHNPAFTSIIGYLSDTLLGHLSTSGIAAISFDIQTWKQVSQASGKLLWVE